MNIHEYQAKQLLGQRGVAIPPWEVCSTAEAAQFAAERFFASGQQLVVVKAQIHAGGRGRGTFLSGFYGGVKLCRNAAEVASAAGAMVGQVLVTKQTGPEGRRVNKVLVAAAPELERELYLAVLLDRATARPVIMATAAGGMDIEEVAAKTPEKIIRESIDPTLGVLSYQGRKLAVQLGLNGPLLPSAMALINGVYQTWWECDASLVEVNPLAVVCLANSAPCLMAIDAKITLDDNALFRHPELQRLRDFTEEAPLETEASKHGLNYIKLEGDIACLVNGAGLAMATMDTIQHYGGAPANFLDVGGGASEQQVTAAFRIILTDPKVRAILVNIFGGIMQCDVIASGIVAAVRETKLALPLVVRLEGNNVETGKRILADSGLAIISADSMSDAGVKVVEAARGRTRS